MFLENWKDKLCFKTSRKQSQKTFISVTLKLLFPWKKVKKLARSECNKLMSIIKSVIDRLWIIPHFPSLRISHHSAHKEIRILARHIWNKSLERTENHDVLAAKSDRFLRNHGFHLRAGAWNLSKLCVNSELISVLNLVLKWDNWNGKKESFATFETGG